MTVDSEQDPINADAAGAADAAELPGGETEAPSEPLGRPRLTGRQAAVLGYIRASIVERGYPPTLREIAAHMGIRSTNGVNDHLRALARKGYLRRVSMQSRGMLPVDVPTALGGGASEGPGRPRKPSLALVISEDPPRLPARGGPCPRCGARVAGVYHCFGCHAYGCGECARCICPEVEAGTLQPYAPPLTRPAHAVGWSR